MADIWRHFCVGKTGKVTVNGNTLAQYFMYRFTKRIVQMRFATQDRDEAVERIIAIIHEHPDVIKMEVLKNWDLSTVRMSC